MVIGRVRGIWGEFRRGVLHVGAARYTAFYQTGKRHLQIGVLVRQLKLGKKQYITYPLSACDHLFMAWFSEALE